MTRVLKLAHTATTTEVLAVRIVPSPQLAIMVAVKKASDAPATATVIPTSLPTLVASEPMVIPAPPRSFPVMPIAGVLLLAGWIGLRVFAPVTAPVLYSESDEDAESSETDLPSESRAV